MKWIGEHIWDFVSRFRNKVILEDLTESTEEYTIMVKADGELVKSVHPMEKSRLEVRNDEGSTIPAGAPLYSKGEIGGSERIKVGICDADDAAKMPCIGIAEVEMNTTSTKDNFAITQGVYNTNISGFSSLSDGDIVYVSSSGSAPYLTQVKPTGEASKIQNVGIVLKTNGTICQGLLVSAIGRANDVPNLNSGYVFYGNGSNQAASTQLSTLLPPDLTTSGTGTIDPNNVPILNQNTTGISALATTAFGLQGAVDGDIDIVSDGHVTIKLDKDNDETFQKLKVVNNSDTEVASITEDGNLYVTGDITNSGSGNDLIVNSDGNMTFTIDRDNNETNQSFSFKNYNVEIANLDESGNLQIDQLLTAKQRHVMRCGFVGSTTATMWLPFNYGGTFDATSSSGYLEYGGVVMPADGYVESVIIRSENACGNSTVAVNVAGTGTEVPVSSPGSFVSGTVNMSADDTAYKFTGFANQGGGSNSFSAGDVVMISFNPTGTSADTTAVAVIVLDWNNAL